MLFGTSVANTVGGNRVHAVKHGQQTLDKNGSPRSFTHSVYPSVCRTDGYGTDRRLQEHALFRAKNVFPFF